MKLLHSVRCRVGWHKWGPVTNSDASGAQLKRQCVHCGWARSVYTERPPETPGNKVDGGLGGLPGG